MGKGKKKKGHPSNFMLKNQLKEAKNDVTRHLKTIAELKEEIKELENKLKKGD